MGPTEALTNSELFIPVCGYTAIALLTWFYMLRRSRGAVGRRVLQLAVSGLWPLYWPLVVGPAQTLTTLIRALSRAIPVLVLFWLLGMIIYPFYFTLYNSQSCTQSMCSDRWVIGIISAPLWPLELHQRSLP